MIHQQAPAPVAWAKGAAGQWRQASKFCRGMAVGWWRPYRKIGSKGPSISDV
jgi:hypothetical protein